LCRGLPVDKELFVTNKRAHDRFSIQLEVTFSYEGAEHAAFSRDIGLGGMFVLSEAKVPFGAEVEVRLSLPALKASTSIPGTVRWHGPGGMGVQWRSLRARQVWALNRLFRKAG
jgi:hypothetical protein